MTAVDVFVNSCNLILYIFAPGSIGILKISLKIYFRLLEKVHSTQAFSFVCFVLFCFPDRGDSNLYW